MSKRLPPNPSLKNLKTKAKQLLKAFKAGEVEAIVRIKASFPPLMEASAPQILAADFSLCQAQLVLAREYGFASWKALAGAVERPEVGGVLPLGPGQSFICASPACRQVVHQLTQIAPSELKVLVLGETGTGKALAARTIHQMSPRQSMPFVQVNCGALPEMLIESELFGYEKGAFTGAHSRRLGKVELAAKGTLFLDEIGDMPLADQCKLLRFLVEGTFERVGGTEDLAADVRVVAATNRDLKLMVQEGRFRQDLYDCLAGFCIEMPPLRQRKEDIPVLASYFAEKQAAHLNKEIFPLSVEVIEALQAHAWPGNIRELEHALQRAVIVCQGATILREDLHLQ